MSKDAGEKRKESSQGITPDREDLGITVRKQEDFSEWYIQVVLKAELADYASGKGFIVLRPNGYDLWEQIKQYFDAIIKKSGHRNAYFPTLIPESLLKRESEHFAGFVPEVFWVTQSGTEELSDKYAVRPTSETIIHDSMSRWIRSWRDLPLLLNVWNSVLRAEIKSTKPFIRSAEFLWQEGHTAHATEQEAEKEVMEILLAYREVMQDLLAIPVYIGKKSDREKFVGAVYTTTLEAMMPDGRAVQMGTSHHLGQNFSRPFEIRFLDKDSELRFVWQTSWGISWRTIGAMIMQHGDDKGLVLPPKVAPVQAVIVPIVFSSGKAAGVLEKCREVEGELSKEGVRNLLDSRDNYTPGWKFNEWEMKGIPIRIEIGPRDLANNTAVLVRRDTGGKSTVKISEVVATTKTLLREIQENLWSQASARLKDQTVAVSSYQDLKSALEKGGFVKAFWCGMPECEIKVKDETGADIRLIPFEEKLEANSSCIVCGKPAIQIVYFARAY
ncbi:MAG TPA: proline--tRNA ligase [Nitrososphaerales archaeon]|nr:proline--tRNA ligase [Nitrososphaerales archaeon]